MAMFTRPVRSIASDAVPTSPKWTLDARQAPDELVA